MCGVKAFKTFCYITLNDPYGPDGGRGQPWGHCGSW